MPEFAPGESKTARAPITVKPAGLACTAELFLVIDSTRVARSGMVPFTSTGAAQSVALPVVMPSAEGTYKVWLDIFAEGIFLEPGYQATEDVEIAAPALPQAEVELIWATPPPFEQGSTHYADVTIRNPTTQGWYYASGVIVVDKAGVERGIERIEYIAAGESRTDRYDLDFDPDHYDLGTYPCFVRVRASDVRHDFFSEFEYDCGRFDFDPVTVVAAEVALLELVNFAYSSITYRLYGPYAGLPAAYSWQVDPYWVQPTVRNASNEPLHIGVRIELVWSDGSTSGGVSDFLKKSGYASVALAPGEAYSRTISRTTKSYNGKAVGEPLPIVPEYIRITLTAGPTPSMGYGVQISEEHPVEAVLV